MTQTEKLKKMGDRIKESGFEGWELRISEIHTPETLKAACDTVIDGLNEISAAMRMVKKIKDPRDANLAFTRNLSELINNAAEMLYDFMPALIMPADIEADADTEAEESDDD